METLPGTILVVDDHDDIRALLTRLLTAKGHTVIAAAGGGEALEQLRDHTPDLVLLDLMMPGISGVQVLERIKQSRTLSHLPVIVISTDGETSHVARCIELGADDYLTKPINTVLLNARIRALLERKQLRDREQQYLQERLRGLSAITPGSEVPGGEAIDTPLRAILDELERSQQARRAAEAELLALNLTLERQVAERTAELRLAQETLQRQASIQESILRSIGDGVVVADIDGQIVLQNPAAERFLAGQIDILIAPPQAGRAARDPNDQRPLARATRGEVVDGADLVLAPAGASPERWLNVTARPLLHQGVIAGGVAVIRDITVAKQHELALRVSEERYALAARGANDGLWDWDLHANQIFYSPRWKAMLGFEDHEIGTSPHEWFDRIEHEDRERLQVRLTAHWQRLLSPFEYEYRIRHRDGSLRWMLCRGLAVWDEDGRALRMAGSQTDITERKAAEQQLQHDALHDALTGLPNRALFTDRLAGVIARARRDPEHRFAVLFLDLDRFKIINDSLGHLAGDQLLITMAERLRSRVRAIDTVARLGGDEFTILLDNLADPGEAAQVAERILEGLSQPFTLSEQEIYTSGSIGIALSGPEYQRPGDILRDADTAMYHAKRHGRSRFSLFEPAMRDQALIALQLETDLRHAIEREELRVYYQPIVALADQGIVSFEALVRWQHPQRGLVSPAEFIPIAEETGQIITIGRWVLQQACRQLRAWQEQFPQTRQMAVSVNISGQQLTHPGLIDDVQGALAETGLPASCLKLEITETALIEHRETAIAVLRAIHTMGIAICLDDFGTGYSSLSYLHHFPIDILKIDRSFINRLGTGGEREEIVQTILALSQSLGIETVAEGLETDLQLARLQNLQCRYGQGWLFARALDVPDVEQLLGAGPGA